MSQERRELWEVVEGLLDAYAARDVEGCLALFADDPGLVSIGTGGEEKSIGIEGLRQGLARDFEQFDDLVYAIQWRHAGLNGGTGWVAAEVSFTVTISGCQVRLPARLTAVLVRQDKNFRIIQSHLSVPMADEDEESGATPPREEE